MFFHKKNRYELDMTTANNALQNILSTCNQPVNTIPFDKLVLRKKVNAASYNRLIVATAVIFVLTFLSPLVIVPLSEFNEKMFAPAPADAVRRDHRTALRRHLQGCDQFPFSF